VLADNLPRLVAQQKEQNIRVQDFADMDKGTGTDIEALYHNWSESLALWEQPEEHKLREQRAVTEQPEEHKLREQRAVTEQAEEHKLRER
jgi:hypothetical protein